MSVARRQLLAWILMIRKCAPIDADVREAADTEGLEPVCGTNCRPNPRLERAVWSASQNDPRSGLGVALQRRSSGGPLVHKVRRELALPAWRAVTALAVALPGLSVPRTPNLKDVPGRLSGPNLVEIGELWSKSGKSCRTWPNLGRRFGKEMVQLSPTSPTFGRSSRN